MYHSKWCHGTMVLFKELRNTASVVAKDSASISLHFDPGSIKRMRMWCWHYFFNAKFEFVFVGCECCSSSELLKLTITSCCFTRLEHHAVWLLLQAVGLLLAVISLCDLVWYAAIAEVKADTYYSEPVDFVDAVVRIATFVSFCVMSSVSLV
jgi:hypothetical protein